MPIAYDCRYAYRSLEKIYDIADEVVLGIDRDRISWSGKPFEFDKVEFLTAVAAIDRRKIVRLVEDDFHSEPTPMANDAGERNKLSAHCRPGHWIIQIDSDEQAVNAKDFRTWLARADRTCDVQARWITVFKTFGDKCLVANEPDGRVSVGTTVPGIYRYARDTGQRKLPSNLLLLHFSWGRTRAELAQKLANWSHSADFDTGRFLQLWDTVTLENYPQFRDFHPLHPPLWSRLSLITLQAGQQATAAASAGSAAVLTA
ncbi:MAG: hypothetical protein HYX71_12740 [Opitutae bacterium]|nr:hypothetical protein [Opitutae bacterium]